MPPKSTDQVSKGGSPCSGPTSSNTYLFSTRGGGPVMASASTVPTYLVLWNMRAAEEGEIVTWFIPPEHWEECRKDDEEMFHQHQKEPAASSAFSSKANEGALSHSQHNEPESTRTSRTRLQIDLMINDHNKQADRTFNLQRGRMVGDPDEFTRALSAEDESPSDSQSGSESVCGSDDEDDTRALPNQAKKGE